MNYKAVIFDLDGTLLYTLGDIADSVNRILSGFGLPVFAEDEYMTMVGHGLEEVLRRAVPPNSLTENAFKMAYDALVNDYKANCVNRTIFYDNITGMLEELSGMGVAFAVLSNKEDDLVQIIASRLLNDLGFHSIQGTKPGVKKKPDPEAVYAILRNMDVDSSRAVFVGDSGVDMKTGVNSGMLSVGVTWGYRDIIELTEAGAQVLIDKPDDLIKILKQ